MCVCVHIQTNYCSCSPAVDRKPYINIILHTFILTCVNSCHTLHKVIYINVMYTAGLSPIYK